MCVYKCVQMLPAGGERMAAEQTHLLYLFNLVSSPDPTREACVGCARDYIQLCMHAD